MSGQAPNRTCPHCGATASLTGVYDDENTGFEVGVWECENGDRWEQPTTTMIVRMIGWGHFWRQRRDEVNKWY